MNIADLVRPNILKLKPYTSARGENLSGILLDANENSLGSVIDEFKEYELNRYPDPNQNELRDKLSRYLKFPKENLFCGVGSDEIIDLLIRIFCEPAKDEVIIPIPTYGMYKVACDINNVSVKEVLLNDKYQININNTVKEFTPLSKILFLCSPNNPTGGLLNKEDIITLIRLFKGIVVLDEAYIDFAEDASLIEEVLKYDNLVILRTFSKAWGLAGIRCGYCAASVEVIDLLFKIKAPYNLNKLTSKMVQIALENYEKKEKYISIINMERERVIEKMKSINGIENVFNSDANFILFKCRNAKGVLKHLSQKGIIIRDRSGQALLENCLRISIGTKEENDLFIKGLQEALCEVSL